MKKVLITGASSFIGNAVAERLRAFPERYEARLVSLRGEEWRQRGFAGWDCVVHAAGIAHVRSKPGMDARYFQINRDLTVAAAERAKADGVGQFIFLSSIIVYGEASPAGVRRWIDADTPPAPVNAYGRSKLEAEQRLRELEDDAFRVAILRLPMVYGAGSKGNYNPLSRLARTLPVFPRFENARSVLYVENLAECVRMAVDDGLRGMFFPQDEQPLSVQAIVRMIAEAHGKRVVFLRCLNPAVRLLGRWGVVRRAFGDMAYTPGMSDMPWDYRRYDSATAIRVTETERKRLATEESHDGRLDGDHTDAQ